MAPRLLGLVICSPVRPIVSLSPCIRLLSAVLYTVLSAFLGLSTAPPFSCGGAAPVRPGPVFVVTSSIQRKRIASCSGRMPSASDSSIAAQRSVAPIARASSLEPASNVPWRTSLAATRSASGSFIPLRVDSKKVSSAICAGASSLITSITPYSKCCARSASKACLSSDLCRETLSDSLSHRLRLILSERSSLSLHPRSGGFRLHALSCSFGARPAGLLWSPLLLLLVDVKNSLRHTHP